MKCNGNTCSQTHNCKHHISTVGKEINPTKCITPIYSQDGLKELKQAYSLFTPKDLT